MAKAIIYGVACLSLVVAVGGLARERHRLRPLAEMELAAIWGRWGQGVICGECKDFCVTIPGTCGGTCNISDPNSWVSECWGDERIVEEPHDSQWQPHFSEEGVLIYVFQGTASDCPVEYCACKNGTCTMVSWLEDTGPNTFLNNWCIPAAQP